LLSRRNAEFFKVCLKSIDDSRAAQGIDIKEARVDRRDYVEE
jgi:hypothetical protein